MFGPIHKNPLINHKSITISHRLDSLKSPGPSPSFTSASALSNLPGPPLCCQVHQASAMHMFDDERCYQLPKLDAFQNSEVAMATTAVNPPGNSLNLNETRISVFQQQIIWWVLPLVHVHWLGNKNAKCTSEIRHPTSRRTNTNT